MHFGERSLGCRLETRKQDILRCREEPFNNFWRKAADSQGVDGKEQCFELVRKLMMSTPVLAEFSAEMGLVQNADEWIDSVEEELAQCIAFFNRGVCQPQVDH